MLEYLIDNYCSEETFHEDMEQVLWRQKTKSEAQGLGEAEFAPWNLGPVM